MTIPRKHKVDLDRYLVLKGSRFHYKRRVPTELVHLDDRAPHVRLSLKTNDLALARQKRDILEQADDALWQAMLQGDEPEITMSQYEAAVARARSLRLAYREASQIGDAASLADIVERVTVAARSGGSKPVTRAVLGYHAKPRVKVSEAFDVYCGQIATQELRSKSEQQRADWKKVKQRAVNNFTDLVGDVPISGIDREDALKLFEFWRVRIAPTDEEIAEGAKVTHSPSSGNRDLGNMRVLFGEYHRHIGEMDRFNPFSGLNFSEDGARSRLPFTVPWLTGKIMRPGALAGLNSEARSIVLAMIETGARPSELANLMPGDIALDAEVPHISIRPRRDPENPRQIKTSTSVRQVPLVGVSLAAMQANPAGFPRYHEKGNALSQLLMKYFRAHGFLPTKMHTIYSIRHTFEDRMKEANLDEELRRILVGHALDRPRYGAGGSLEWRRDCLLKMVLPFDRTIV